MSHHEPRDVYQMQKITLMKEKGNDVDSEQNVCRILRRTVEKKDKETEWEKWGRYLKDKGVGMEWRPKWIFGRIDTATAACRRPVALPADRALDNNACFLETHGLLCRARSTDPAYRGQGMFSTRSFKYKFRAELSSVHWKSESNLKRVTRSEATGNRQQ